VPLSSSKPQRLTANGLRNMIKMRVLSLHVFIFFYMLQLCNPLPELSARAFIARLLTGRAVRSGSPILRPVSFSQTQLT